MLPSFDTCGSPSRLTGSTETADGRLMALNELPFRPLVNIRRATSAAVRGSHRYSAIVVLDEAYREFVTDPRSPDGIDFAAEHRVSLASDSDQLLRLGRVLHQ